MSHQSLYRRYRPRRFSEVRGQDHVVAALRNAVRDRSESHAYLFSGPRGTGKTSTARIFAKALNCDAPADGEPCCECDPCLDMEAGRSFDLFELDAASHNGVDAMRDLVERASVGSPGRTKVYILDEVHMLSTGASNALLKTLEEPPDHVRFVLATTDPQKVLPTIRSRTQHYDFQLLSAVELESQVRDIAADAQLDVDDEAIAWVVHQGRGSSRDTLSALDQVVAAGGVPDRSEPLEEIYDALVARDAGAAIVAVATAVAEGRDPRVLTGALIDSLRDTFLVSLSAPVPHLLDDEYQMHRRWADALGTARLTAALEAIGTASVDMRHAADPRVPLEVALVQLASGGADVAALIERIDRLEAALAQGQVPHAPAPSPSPGNAAPEPSSGAAPSAQQPDTPRDSGGRSSAAGPAAARAELARLRAARGGSDDPGTPPAGGSPASPPSPPAQAQPDPPPAPQAGSTRRGPSPEGRGAPEPPPPVPSPPERGGAAPDRVPPVPPAPPAQTRRPRQDDPASAERSVSASEASTPPAAADPADPAVEPPAASAAATGALPDVARLNQVLAESVVADMKGLAKALFSTGVITGVDGDQVVLTLPGNIPMDRAEKRRAEVEKELATAVGVPLRLVLASGEPETLDRSGAGRGDDAAPGAPDEDDLVVDVHELEDATDVAATGVDRLIAAFPGAEIITEDEVEP